MSLSSASGHDSNVSNSSVEHSPDASFGSNGSGSSSRFAHLWGFEGRRLIGSNGGDFGKAPILEVNDGGSGGGSGGQSGGEEEQNTSGASLNECGAAGGQLETNENSSGGVLEDDDLAAGGATGITAAAALDSVSLGLEGFGRLSVGDPVSSISTASFTPQGFTYPGTPEAGFYRPPNFSNHDEYGQMLNNSGMDTSPFRSTGRRPFGFDGPSMTPPAFSMPSRDFEDRTPASPEGSRGNDFMSRLAALDQYAPRPCHTGLTIRQTIEQLKMLQELQDFAHNSGGDPFQRRQISALITTLQQHLMTQYSPNHSASPTSPPPYQRSKTDGYLERAALYHREMAQVSSANLKWTGILPPKRNYRDQIYSTKVFLGGLPWEVTETCLVNTFKPFGRVRVEWPGKDGNRPKGYAYVLFDTERQVKHLLQHCTHDYNKSADYIRLCSRYVNKKDIQVIPWAVGDSNYVRCPDTKLDPQKTIFVGALHGMLNAEGLAHIMQELFGGVVYAGIDTDRNKYPIGSGRVTFDNDMSYLKAVTAAFIEIRTNEFTKKIQVDPYLEDATCSICKVQQGPYFCRDVACFNYFCSSCFQSVHMEGQYRGHRPLMRNANKIGTPTSIMPTNFRARSSLTEISHSSGLLNRCGSSLSNQQRQWERFYE